MRTEREHLELMLKSAKARFTKGIRMRGERLRRLADELDRQADRSLTVGTPDWQGSDMANNAAWFASQVQHEVVSVLPNLLLDQLTTDARDLDEMIRARDINQVIDEGLAAARKREES